MTSMDASLSPDTDPSLSYISRTISNNVDNDHVNSNVLYKISIECYR